MSLLNHLSMCYHMQLVQWPYSKTIIFPLQVGKLYIREMKPLPDKPGSDAISLYHIPKILSPH